MSDQVFVEMPLEITRELLLAVRSDPLTRCEDRDEMNLRIGWLICAYDVMVQARLKGCSDEH